MQTAFPPTDAARVVVFGRDRMMASFGRREGWTNTTDSFPPDAVGSREGRSLAFEQPFPGRKKRDKGGMSVVAPPRALSCGARCTPRGGGGQEQSRRKSRPAGYGLPSPRYSGERGRG